MARAGIRTTTRIAINQRHKHKHVRLELANPEETLMAEHGSEAALNIFPVNVEEGFDSYGRFPK
jgi:hypothetical protein